jgi:DNA-binding beta-propeller fold protein YncE
MAGMDELALRCGAPAERSAGAYSLSAAPMGAPQLNLDRMEDALPAHRRVFGAALTLLASVALLLAPAAALGASGGGRVLAGSVPLRGLNVTLLAANPGASRPVVLGRARSRRGGRFVLRYRSSNRRAVRYLLATRPCCAAEAGFPVVADTYKLGLALGAGSVPPQATLNERTTVAMGYAMAQFIHGNRVAGKDPGLRNAAAMSRNLVRRRGTLASVLARFPNGSSTSTLRSFDSLANLLALCRRQDRRCARLLRLGGTPGEGAAGDTLQATVDIAVNPWRNVEGLFKLSRLAAAPRPRYAPALGRRQLPDAWTLALRFEGSPPAMDGPGNFAIDARGGIWVGNNYEHSRESTKPTCFGRKLFRFTPTGRYFPGSPYESGGTSGVGFGITIDKDEHVWVGNFGFEGKGCRKEAPHNSVSEYEPNGKALSPELAKAGIRRKKTKKTTILVQTYTGGWEVGDIFWPQATIADVNNNIWVANCGNNSVTMLRDADPGQAVNFPESHFSLLGGFRFTRPFGAASDAAGNVYVGGNGSATVVEMGPDGEVLDRFSGGGLHRPLGLATDSRGNVWVSNSTWVVAPCVGQFHPERGPRKGGSVTLIERDGDMPAQDPFEGGGLKNAWGIAVDGADHVWVANFSGRRLSELCGVQTRLCPPGKRRIGAPISPETTGYGFNGLVRNTGVAVDPSGNVWLANNWKDVPIQTNPGGYQIVVYLGLAAPVKTPLIGQPERP